MVEPSDITTHPPRAQITRELVQPPSRVYLGVDDRLYIRSRNSVTAVTLQVAGRLLTADGSIVPFNFEHVPLTTRAVSLESFRLAEGYLLSAVVFPSVGAPLRGQTFVELGLLRGRDAAASVVDVLARDYVAEEEPLAFPGGPTRLSIEGPGALLSITGTDQAANTEVVEAVPANALWRPRSIRFTLVTDANAASRRVHLIIDDGTIILLSSGANTTQIESLTRNYNCTEMGTNLASALSEIYIPFPSGLLLGAGMRIQTATTNIQVGDNFGAPQLLVEEWIQD